MGIIIKTFNEKGKSGISLEDDGSGDLGKILAEIAKEELKRRENVQNLNSDIDSEFPKDKEY